MILIGYEIQGVFADICHEARETRAALPLVGRREPREKLVPKFRSPTCVGVAQGVGVGDLLAIRSAFCSLFDSRRIAIITSYQCGSAQFFRRLAGGLRYFKQRHRLRHDRGPFELDQ